MLLESGLNDALTVEADQRYYVFGNYIDEVLVMANVDSGNGVTDGDYYYGHDHSYSPTVLFADTGTIVERYEYNAYRKCTGRRLDILDTNGSLKYNTAEQDTTMHRRKNSCKETHLE